MLQGGRKHTKLRYKCTIVCVCRYITSSLCCVYLLYLVYDEVTFIAQNSRCVSVLFGQQVEPLCYSIHHGQNNGPQEAQDIKDPLDSFTMTCVKSKHIHTQAHIHRTQRNGCINKNISTNYCISEKIQGSRVFQSKECQHDLPDFWSSGPSSSSSGMTRSSKTSLSPWPTLTHRHTVNTCTF